MSGQSSRQKNRTHMVQGGKWPMPLSRSLAHLEREISEKKWVKARRWARNPASAKKYKMRAMARDRRVREFKEMLVLEHVYEAKLPQEKTATEDEGADRVSTEGDGLRWNSCAC